MKKFRFPARVLFLAALPLLLLGGTTACTEDVIDDGPEIYLPQTSENNVLNNFVVAYSKRDIERYSELLADDFQFYFDPDTRDEIGVTFWTRLEDSTKTEILFKSPDVTGIKIQLQWDKNGFQPSNQGPPRDTWRTIRLSGSQVLLEVDFAPAGSEVTTFQVAGDPHRFYFRKGKSPTPAPTDTLWYLVEWRDEGNLESTSFSEIKAR